MRVLLVSYLLPYPPVDGERLPIYHFLRCLAPRVRYHLLTVAPRDGRARGRELEEGRALFESWGVTVETVAPASGGRAAQAWRCLRHGQWWVNRFYWPELAALTARRLAEGGWDLVQIDNLLTAQHLPRRPGVPAILVARDCLSLRHWRLWRLRGNPLELARWAKMRRMEAALYPRFDRVMAISPTDAAAMRALAPRTRIELLPNGVDLTKFVPCPEAEQPGVVMFTGAMDYGPNVDGALWLARKVWPLVRARRSDARLLIVGRDPTAEVRALAAANRDIEVTGATRSMEEWLARAAVVVSPLRWGTGIKNKVLEGAAMARAMVATPVSLEDIALEPGRDVRLAESPQVFAAEIVSLLEDAAERRRLGDSARKVIEARYTWDSAAEILWRSYQDVLGA